MLELAGAAGPEEPGWADAVAASAAAEFGPASPTAADGPGSVAVRLQADPPQRRALRKKRHAQQKKGRHQEQLLHRYLQAVMRLSIIANAHQAVAAYGHDDLFI